jgi:hypothetical protein
MDDKNHINFDAPATLRKWPSIKNERVSAADGGRPYLIFDGTLDDCIRQFMAKPVSQHHLYDIQTAPQGELAARGSCAGTKCCSQQPRGTRGVAKLLCRAPPPLAAVSLG